MPWKPEALRFVYDRTSGRCHLCGKKLSWINYGRRGARGAWHVDHSVPRTKGGTNHRNNLYAACIVCNREKDTFTAKTARSWHGRQRAPLSHAKRAQRKKQNAAIGGAVGGLLGAVVLGPVGAVVGAGIGAKLGHNAKPDD